MTQEIAKLTIDGNELELAVITGAEQEKAIDITKLRGQTGYITIDAGYGNTGACTSSITFLDGEEGILRYRGIPIEQLAESATYPEVAYLLIYGRLPNASELETFSSELIKRAPLPEGFDKILDQIPADTHPMAILSSLVSTLAGYYPDKTNPNPSLEEMDDVMLTLMGVLPTIAAYSYRRSQGLDYVAPRADLSYEANYLYMTFGEEPSAEVEQAMRQMFILHADHEQNCSTSTVRIVGSSRANAFAAISAGIGALWGPLHGGANQAVIEMLAEIEADGGDFNKFLALAKDKESSFRLMGFGHRVYKNFDPRSRIIKVACDTVLDKLGVQDPQLALAKNLEQAALEDSYFVDRKLYPNVDFYSGIILKAMGIPTEQFTVIFALGRLSGWLAHWREMLLSPGFRIYRPRQIYTGPTVTDLTPLDQR